MLRGAGGIRRQHITQVVLSIGKRHQLFQTILPFRPCIHSSCSSHAAHSHALTLDSLRLRRVPEGNPSAHVYDQLLDARISVTPSTHSGLDAHTSQQCGADCGPFPSGVMDVVNVFMRGTTEQRKCIVQKIKNCPATCRYFTHRENATRLAQAMVSTTQPSRAHVVMAIAHRLGCRFKPSHFESVVHELSLRECWSLIPPLVSFARHQCGRTTARLLNWKMRAFIECHRFDKLDRVIMEFSREGIKPLRRTFHLLVSGHLRNRDLDSAKKGIETMENVGFPPDASTYALIATVYRFLGLDHQVHTRALDAIRDVDARMATHVLNSIVQHFLDVGDETGAAQYIRFFSLTDVDDSVIADLGNDTTGVAGATSHQKTDPVYPPRINPDAATFTILIDYMANQRRFCQVYNLVARLVEAKAKPDSGIIAALIRAYSLNNRDDLAVSLFAAMLHPGGADGALHSLCRITGMKLASEQPIDVKHIPLTVHVFNAILGRIMELRGLTGARFIFRAMRSRNIQPSAATIEIFLDYLDRTENVTPRQLIRFLRSMSTAVYGLTLRHFHVILRNILRREKYLAHGTGWNATAAMCSPTRERIPVPRQGRVLLSSDNFDPGSGLRLPRRFRYDSWLRPIVLFLSRRGINGDRATIAMRLRHESMVDPSLGTARDVLRHMAEKGMHPNQYHYVALMDGYAKEGNMSEAERTMESASEAGFKPEVIMYTVLITGYGRQGKPQLAMRAFHRMVSAGIPPDIPAIDALACAYFAVGAYKVARRILLQLWTQVKPFPSELQGASLKQLATAFRANSRKGPCQKRPLTKQQQKLLSWKIRGFQQEWKQVVTVHSPRVLRRRLNRCRAWLLRHSWDSAGITTHHTCNV